jgi:hypothetical protein
MYVERGVDGRRRRRDADDGQNVQLRWTEASKQASERCPGGREVRLELLMKELLTFQNASMECQRVQIAHQLPNEEEVSICSMLKCYKSAPDCLKV